MTSSGLTRTLQTLTWPLVYVIKFPTPSGPLWSNVVQDLSDGCVWHFNSTPYDPSSPIWACAEFYKIPGLCLWITHPLWPTLIQCLARLVWWMCLTFQTLPPMNPSGPIWACAEFYQIPGLCLWIPHPLWPTLIQCRARFVWWVRLTFQLYPLWPPQAQYDMYHNYDNDVW